MKKLQLFSILTFLLISTTYGQKECSELELKNSELNSELTKKDGIINVQKQNIAKLESDVKYYKESLNLMNSKIIVEQDDFVLKINSVKGKSDNGIIIIEGLVENKGILRAFRQK